MSSSFLIINNVNLSFLFFLVVLYARLIYILVQSTKYIVEMNGIILDIHHAKLGDTPFKWCVHMEDYYKYATYSLRDGKALVIYY